MGVQPREAEPRLRGVAAPPPARDRLREPLRAARVAFDELDTPAWCDRARQELRAAGETSKTRQPEAWDELSAQELQIATLAAAGLSNREIGQRLYISPRTVANHLYRIFPKLGVTTRGQLAGVLPDQRVADSARSPST